jgi:hypothetical protein
MNTKDLLNKADKLLLAAGNSHSTGFQQSAVSQAADLVSEALPLVRATGFSLVIFNSNNSIDRFNLQHSFENPWSIQAKLETIRTLNNLITKIINAEQFK